VDDSPVQNTFTAIRRSAQRIGRTAEGWILQAEAQRRFHYRSDGQKIEELLRWMATNSLLFGSLDDDADEGGPQIRRKGD